MLSLHQETREGELHKDYAQTYENLDDSSKTVHRVHKRGLNPIPLCYTYEIKLGYRNIVPPFTPWGQYVPLTKFLIYLDGDGVGEGPGGLCGIEASETLAGSSDNAASCERGGEPNGNSNPAACFTNSISEAVRGGWAGFAAVAT